MSEYSEEIARILVANKLDPRSVKISLYELHPKSLIAVVREYGTLLGCGQGTTHGTAVYAAMVNRRLRLMFTHSIRDRLATLERRLNEQRRLPPHFIVDQWGEQSRTHGWSIRLFSGELLLAQAGAHSLQPTMRQLLDTAHKTLSKSAKIPQLLVEVSAERGEAEVHRIQTAADSVRQEVPWITTVRRSTEQEEARGSHLVIETDRGGILLRVVASLSEREAVLRRTDFNPAILVIVADSGETSATLKRGLAVLLNHRYAALAQAAATQST